MTKCSLSIRYSIWERRRDSGESLGSNKDAKECRKAMPQHRLEQVYNPRPTTGLLLRLQKTCLRFLNLPETASMPVIINLKLNACMVSYKSINEAVGPLQLSNLHFVVFRATSEALKWSACETDPADSLPCEYAGSSSLVWCSFNCDPVAVHDNVLTPVSQCALYCEVVRNTHTPCSLRHSSVAFKIRTRVCGVTDDLD